MKKSLYFLFPSFLVFLLMGAYFNGMDYKITEIVDSWREFAGSYEYMDSISKLYWTFKTKDEVILWRIAIFKEKPYYIVFFFLNMILIFLSIFVYLNKNLKFKASYIFYFLLLQYLALISISLIAVDYVRWYWLTNIITILTLVCINYKKDIMENKKTSLWLKINSYNKIAILFIGLPLGGSWSISQYIYTMPIKQVLDLGDRLLHFL